MVYSTVHLWENEKGDPHLSLSCTDRTCMFHNNKIRRTKHNEDGIYFEKKRGDELTKR